MLFLKAIFCALFNLIVQEVSSSGVFHDRSPKHHNESYFVLRLDTNQGTCVSKFVNVLQPVYEIAENDFVKGGFRWDRSHAWKLTGLETSAIKIPDSQAAGDTFLITDGSQKFQFLDEESFVMTSRPHYLSDESRAIPRLSILAENATLLLTGSENWQGQHGTLLEIDHFNPETKGKETRVRVCHDVSLQGERNCGIVLRQPRTNYLRDGKDYVTFFIEKQQRCNPDGRCANKYELHDKHSKLGAWHQRGVKQDFVFARSNGKAGVFMNEKQLFIEPIAGRPSNKLRKLFTQTSKGTLVVRVVWKERTNTHNQVQISAKNLNTNRIVYASRQRKYTGRFSTAKTVSKVEFDQLEAGDYEITLYNVAEPIQNIYLCSGKVCAPEENKMQHQRVVGCHLFLGEMPSTNAELTLYDSSKCNFNVSPNWESDDWSYVCAQLGFMDAAAYAVDVKLCNRHGCVVTTCPHRGRQPHFKCPA